jgi:hypothetical protein
VTANYDLFRNGAMLGAGDVFKRSTALVGLELHCTPDADLNRRRPATLGKTNGRGYFGLYSFSLILILHRLNRDSDAQMSCNSAIGGIPLGRHANRTCLEPSRRQCPRHTLHSGMQSPGRNQGVLVKQCAEKYVDRDVDCPDQHIGHCHFAWLPQDLPEKQNIQGNRSGNHRPLGCTQALDTVSEQADKTADC